MEGQGGKAAALEERFQIAFREVVTAHSGSAVGGEDVVVLLPAGAGAEAVFQLALAMDLERGKSFGEQPYRAPGGFPLRSILCRGPLEGIEGALDTHDAAAPVYVCPLEALELSAYHACGECQNIKGFEAITSCSLEEPTDVLSVQGLSLRVALLWGRGGRCSSLRDPMLRPGSGPSR